MKIPVAKEGWRFITPLAFLTLVFVYLELPCTSSIVGGLTLFVVYFFRDPERIVPQDENAVISPADGKIVVIKNVQGEGDSVERLQVSIFLSVFNVHVNRLPVGGRISDIKYTPGKYLVAFNEKASELNEQNNITIETPKGVTVGVKQIAGLIARRIIWWINTGDNLKTGDRFGLIRFGSRVDINLPANVALDIKMGDKVKGGETIIGRLP